ncbi:glycerate kinase, partial [Burkholderia multivorans]
AGAAGGLGFALRMLGAQFEAGAEVVARQIGLDAALEGADWLITGEGRSDVQTLHGKAPFIACRHAQAAGVPASLLSGAIDPAALPRLSEYFSGCFSPAPGPISLDVAIRDAATLLANEAEQLTRLKYGAH